MSLAHSFGGLGQAAHSFHWFPGLGWQCQAGLTLLSPFIAPKAVNVVTARDHSPALCSC